MAELLPCPFCGGTDIELSIKRTTYPFWYTSMYCKKCNCYGARTRVTVEGTRWVSRNDIVKSENTKQIAIKAWNTRTPQKEGADKPKITCLNCKHLVFSDMYGECNKQLRIVKPSDTCEYAEPKERGAE